jgi:competence protein ComEA
MSAPLAEIQQAASRRVDRLWSPPPAPGWVPAQTRTTEWEPAEHEAPPTAPAGRDDQAAVLSPPPGLTSMVGAAIEDRLPPWAQAIPAGTRRRLLVAVVLVVVAVVAAGVLLVRHHAAGGSAYPVSEAGSFGSSSQGGASGAGTADLGPVASPANSAATIVVDVGGKVHKPGLVTLPAGSRVADALAAAGGPLRAREVRSLDLAAKVGDGQLLLIGTSNGASSATADSGADGAAGTVGTDGSGGTDPTGAAPIDLNSATDEQLETLPGVGPVTAQKIIDWRTAHNGFTDVSELQQVPGIGPTRYAELSPLVTA